LNDFVVI
jgi:26S proteasome regulatory subunit N3